MITKTGMGNEPCPHCGMTHATTCPKIKAIEYFEDGSVKRVEFMTTADYLAPIATAQPTWPTPVWGPATTTG